MRTSHSFPLFFLASQLFATTTTGVNAQSSSDTIEVQWSSDTHGPDGPWHAISLTIGTPESRVDAYPSWSPESIIMGDWLCEPAADNLCMAQSGGFFGRSVSETWNHTLQSWNHGNRSFVSGHHQMHGDGYDFVDSFRLENTRGAPTIFDRVTMEVASFPYFKLPNQTHYRPSVSEFSLGIWSEHYVNGSDPETDDPVLGYMNQLVDTSAISSASFGLQVGAATVDLRPSLVLGGYDKSRISGSCSGQTFSPYRGDQGTEQEQPWGARITLRDVAITAGSGDSPFEFGSSKAELLNYSTNNSTVDFSDDGLSVEIEPLLPYLYLPESTCSALAKELPVELDADLGLYLWQTNNDLYTDIMASSASLSFTFTQRGGDAQAGDTMTISVPFKVLDLTLDPPLVGESRKYFPCRGVVDSWGSDFKLGRAFLQAAYVAVGGLGGIGNWEDVSSGLPRNTFWLCPAAGPKADASMRRRQNGDDIQVIAASLSTLESSGASWAESWGFSAAQSPGDNDNNNGGGSGDSNSSSTDNESSGTNVGAIAGGVVGGVVVIAAIIAGVIFWRRKKRSQPNELDGAVHEIGSDSGPAGASSAALHAERKKSPATSASPAVPASELDGSNRSPTNATVSSFASPGQMSHSQLALSGGYGYGGEIVEKKTPAELDNVLPAELDGGAYHARPQQ